MTELRETAAVIALVRRGDRARHHYSELVEAAGSAVAVLEDATDEPDLALFEDAPVAAPADLDAIAAEVAGWRAEGIAVLTVLDEGYPANLRTVHDRPPLLFVHGELTDADERSVAVVGTRRASDDGLLRATEVAAAIAGAGYTVASGLAAGVDTAAHEAALATGGRTVAVIGTGLRRSYPRENAELQRRIAREGAVVSQFWPDAPPSKTSFPMRNAVMSGVALATVVIEAAERSGARMQAGLALKHGRPVFLLASLLAEGWAREFAERPGTYVVDSGDDVLEHVGRLTALDTLTA
jgi:DNA processing protein